ncbi:Hypothetical protein D9617_9g025830 [Elsinoe fawcettii]|nr:Hypothetical protein D9617_9g025830 [Elsinoe fawcettii]
MLQAVAFLAFAASAALASPLTERQSSISWGTCDTLRPIEGKTLQCGSLNVPLDYRSPSGGKLRLALYKIPAIKQPAKGSIIFNFGGPGVASGDYFTSGGYEFPALSNYEYDLITFDPRGTGLTIPYSCFSNDFARNQVYAQTTGFGDSPAALKNQFQAGGSLAKACQQRMAQEGELVGTAYVARDIANIAEAIEEDGLIRYWGFSYGTLLGTTLAAMFPDRIEKMVLDGNVNAPEYYNGVMIDAGYSTDAVAAGFFAGCTADPAHCALAESNLTATQLQAKVMNAFAALPMKNLTLAGYPITQPYVLYSFFNALYAPSEWPGTALTLKAILTRNETLFVQATSTEQVQPAFADEGIESFYGITCSDAAFRASNVDDFVGPAKSLYTYSNIYGPLAVGSVGTCARWPFSAKEREVGPWNIKTRSPILFIGNTADPITPLVSAFNSSAMFPGSAVLHHNGYGHCSSAQPSTCTALVTRAYWENGTLPAPGMTCQPDYALFSGLGWRDLLAKLDPQMKNITSNVTGSRIDGPFGNNNNNNNLGPSWIGSSGSGTNSGDVQTIYATCGCAHGQGANYFNSGGNGNSYNGQGGGQGSVNGNGQGSGQSKYGGQGSGQGNSTTQSGSKTPSAPITPFKGGAAGSAMASYVVVLMSLFASSLHFL